MSARILCKVFIAASLLVLHGCTTQEQTPMSQQIEKSSSAGAADNATSSPKKRALKAKETLFKRLSSELMAAMASGGPGAAIEVCSQQAPKIAAEVGKEHGVSIGRTSFQLRNPANHPPEWAATFVEQRVAEPQFVELNDQTTGALLPIHLKAQCLVCHGPTDQIAADVKQQLAQRYPEDNATGFKDGDLRGWFWVEVPNAPVNAPR